MAFSPFNLFLGLNSAVAAVSGSKKNPSPWGKDFKHKYFVKGAPFYPGSAVISYRPLLNQFWIDWDCTYYGTLDFVLVSVAIQATPPQPIWKTMKWSEALTIAVPNSEHPVDGYPIMDSYESAFGTIPSGPWNVGFVVRIEVSYSYGALLSKWNRQLITTTFP